VKERSQEEGPEKPTKKKNRCNSQGSRCQVEIVHHNSFQIVGGGGLRSTGTLQEGAILTKPCQFQG